MLSAKVIAEYFLSKDKNNKIFNNKVVIYNNRKSYEGNIRLNKYLFFSQIVYMAKYGKKLIKDDFCAYDNGPVVEEIMNNFKTLKKDNLSLENATYEELIDISHEDPEWINLSNDTYNAPVMNLEKNIEEYKKRYKGLIEALKL